MSLLDSISQSIEIKLYYKEIVNQYGVRAIKIIPDEIAEEKLTSSKESSEEQIKLLVTTWKILSWKDDNDIVRDATKTDVISGNASFNAFLYRDLKVKKCIIGWDMKDNDGKDIPFSPEILDKMPADIMYALINKYEKITSMNEEEIKN